MWQKSNNGVTNIHSVYLNHCRAMTEACNGSVDQFEVVGMFVAQIRKLTQASSVSNRMGASLAILALLLLSTGWRCCQIATRTRLPF